MISASEVASSTSSRSNASSTLVPVGPLSNIAACIACDPKFVERVPEMLEFYGEDVILLIGGALLSAGDQLLARSRDFAAAVAQPKRQGVTA